MFKKINFLNKGSLTKRRHFLNGSVLEYLLVGFLFFILTTIYTNWILFSINSSIFTGQPGDATAGFLWILFADQDLNPAWAYTHLVNYPNGEQIGSPVYVSWSLLLIPLWVLAKIFSPIAAVNIMTMAGFMLTSMSAYWLIKRLTGNIWVSFFAGFAAAFVPYHIMKSSAHLAYVFSWVFIIMIAAFYAFWSNPTKKRALILAIAVAIGFYTDGYYLLLCSVLLATLVASGLLYDLIFVKKVNVLKQKVKLLVLTAFTLTLLASPLLLVQLFMGSKVSSDLADARGNIAHELEYYSAERLDFLLPPAMHPVLEDQKWFQDAQNFKNRRSNVSENTLYVGYVILGLFIAGMILALTIAIKKIRQRQVSLEQERINFFGFVSLLVVIVCMAFMMPLTETFGGYSFTTIPGYMAQFNIAFWRVLARFFLPMHAMMVVFSSLVLAYFVYKIQQRSSGNRHLLNAVIIIPLVALMAFEYATTFNRPTWSLSKVPETYYWLKEQDDISVIAEVPMSDPPLEYSSYYVTSQMVHGKKIINSPFATSESKGIRRLQNTLQDPETIEFAAARGAQVIITHHQKCSNDFKGVSLIRSEKSKEGFPQIPVSLNEHYLCVYKIGETYQHDEFFLSAKRGFNETNYDPSGATQLSLINDTATLEVDSVNQEHKEAYKVGSVSFKLLTTPRFTPTNITVRISSGSKTLYEGEFSGTTDVTLENVETNKEITVKISSNAPIEPNQISISNAKVQQ
ncbi:hypothetical protein CYG49_02825 [Candidatus Saccharibacteria bacterium]|nr:MAG: hypothetical protein CYG49_02825 [Candidatus Saccharibacteria bacterium]